MKEIPVRELQLMKLEALKSFMKFCNERNLRFFMAGGSLIGTIREKGYIEWDDDIDLYMLREDFDKFLSLSHDALGGKYFVQSYKTDPYFFIPMGRICLNGTYRCETGLDKVPFNKGSIIDIFPVDNAPDNFNVRAKQFKKCHILISLMRYKVSKPRIDGFYSLLTFILHCSLKVISLKTMHIWANNMFKKYRNCKSNILIAYSGIRGLEKETFMKSWFADAVYMPFEDTMVPCPVGYDELLTSMYGNYMERPSRENRKIDTPSFYLP